jgi:hypothetical protein
MCNVLAVRFCVPLITFELVSFIYMGVKMNVIILDVIRRHI